MTRETSSADVPGNNATDYAQLQLAYQRLLVLERFKKRLLARTSHELRSPINTIVSLSQLILEDLCEGPEEEKEFITQSKAAALKMLALFDQVAAVSKLDVGREPPKLEATDLSFLLPEVEMLTTLQAANQNVRYKVELPADEVEVYTDSKWLKNILVSQIQALIPQTKTLRLGVEQTEQSVTVVVECDRPAAQLQAELEQVSQQMNETEEGETKLLSPTEIETFQLSTGLILATAQTALPLIKGEFAIAASDSSSDEPGSCLRFTFPVPSV